MNQASRKPLLVRGARQVGKTHAARKLGLKFPSFVEINLEENEKAQEIIERDFDVHRVILQLSELVGQPIVPGKTLLFFDEIQSAPKALTMLRYFYEKIPTLHVIVAGSLIEFAIDLVGMPVGRITSLYMYPMSFVEFLAAQGHAAWIKAICTYTPSNPMSSALHATLLAQVSTYLAVGGMPEVVKTWISSQTSHAVSAIHADLLDTYQQDFGKYAKNNQIKYLDLLLQKALEQLSRKFMFARVGEYKKRELAPALDLLAKAGLIHRVFKTAGHGVPLGAQADSDDFKIVFLDVGLTQALLHFNIASWLIDPLTNFVNKGEIVEAFVGQELLAYAPPIRREQLFYWRCDTRGSEAEVDYLIQSNELVVPLEVKAGTSKHIKSLFAFLKYNPLAPHGIRLSARNYEQEGVIQSYPLFAVIKPLMDTQEFLREAVESLIL